MARARREVRLCSVVFIGLLTLLGQGWVDAGTSADIGPLPAVPVPEDNPLTPEKIELGGLLFFDARLSADGSLACVSCHLPDQGWATHTPLSIAYPTNMERRISPTLVNVAYNKALLWDGRAGSLEKQALGPIQNPLHMNQNLDLLIEKLNAIPDYAERFQKVFGTSVNPEALGKALATFERTLIARHAPFDRYMVGDQQAMSESAVRGMALFKGKARCILCHNGPNFTDSQFHNLGVPDAPLLTHPLVQASIRFDAKRMNVPDYAQVKEDLGRYLVTKEEKGQRGVQNADATQCGTARSLYAQRSVSITGGNHRLLQPRWGSCRRKIPTRPTIGVNCPGKARPVGLPPGLDWRSSAPHLLRQRPASSS